MARLTLTGAHCSICGAPIRGGAACYCRACGEVYHSVCWPAGTACLTQDCKGVEPVVLEPSLTRKILPRDKLSSVRLAPDKPGRVSGPFKIPPPPPDAVPPGPESTVATPPAFTGIPPAELASLLRSGSPGGGTGVAGGKGVPAELSQFTREMISLDGRRSQVTTEMRNMVIQGFTTGVAVCFATTVFSSFMWYNRTQFAWLTSSAFMYLNVILVACLAAGIGIGIGWTRSRLATGEQELKDLETIQVQLLESFHKQTEPAQATDPGERGPVTS